MNPGSKWVLFMEKQFNHFVELPLKIKKNFADLSLLIKWLSSCKILFISKPKSLTPWCHAHLRVEIFNLCDWIKIKKRFRICFFCLSWSSLMEKWQFFKRYVAKWRNVIDFTLHNIVNDIFAFNGNDFHYTWVFLRTKML